MQKQWLRVAHRGASGSAPEHTSSAFRRALNVGVDMIELDVQMSKDGELVILHDFDLDRTTSGHGAVRDHEWNAIRQLDAGAWYAPEYAGERVLTLSQVADLVEGRARLNVELKAAAELGEVLAGKVVEFLSERKMLAETIVSCFDADTLRVARSQSHDVALGVLTHEPDLKSAWEVARELRAVSIHPYWAFVTPENVARSHEQGLKVIAWTVNELEAMETLVVQGVDGIISDYPERFSRVRAELTG